MSKSRHIVALGGGGFSNTPDNPALDRYILDLADKRRPKVCFIGTASGDADSYYSNFYRNMARHHPEAQCTHLPLFVQKGETASIIKSSDVFYVGGGNTFNLLLLWRAWGVDVLLREAYESGKIMAGISAGGNCWFEQFLTDSTGDYTLMTGLGWLKGAFSPHFDSQAKRQPVYKKLLKDNELEGWAAEEEVAVHFINEKAHRVVTTRKGGLAHHFTLPKGVLKEKALKPDLLK